MQPVLNAISGRIAPISAESHEEEVLGAEESGGGEDGLGCVLFPEESAPCHIIGRENAGG